MSEKIEKYRLRKDMPEFKAGEIFTLTKNGFNDEYYQSENTDDWGLPKMYQEATILNNPEWFADANEPITEPIESENRMVGDTIKVHGSEFDFNVTMEKDSKPTACKFCGKQNLVWAETKKGKKILIGLNDKNEWIAHISECPRNIN